jgi:hypothetical protein
MVKLHHLFQMPSREVSTVVMADVQQTWRVDMCCNDVRTDICSGRKTRKIYSYSSDNPANVE